MSQGNVALVGGQAKIIYAYAEPTVHYGVKDVSELYGPTADGAIRANSIICIDDEGFASHVTSLRDDPDLYFGDCGADEALAGFDFSDYKPGLYYAQYTEVDDYVAGGHEPSKSFRGFVWEISHAICLLVRRGR